MILELLLLDKFDAQLIDLRLILLRYDVIVVKPAHVVNNCNDAVLRKVNIIRPVE